MLYIRYTVDSRATGARKRDLPRLQSRGFACPREPFNIIDWVVSVLVNGRLRVRSFMFPGPCSSCLTRMIQDSWITDPLCFEAADLLTSARPRMSKNGNVDLHD